MRPLSQGFIDRVKAAVNLKELAESYGAELEPAGDNIWHCCCPHPDHNDDTPSFTVWHNEDGGWTWCCFGCHNGAKDPAHGNYGTDCAAFIQWMSNGKIGFRKIMEILAEHAGIPMEVDEYAGEYQKNRLRAKGFHVNLPNRVRRYLYERGLDDADIDKWNIGYNMFPEYWGHTKLKVERITFPIYDAYDNVLGFSNRKFSHIDNDDVPKYWNDKTSPWFNKGSCLYGIQNLDKEFPEIRIVEGQMDTILAHKHGVKNVVASMSTSFTKKHAMLLANLGITPVFLMDADKAGQDAMKKCVNYMLELGIYAKVFVVPIGKDIADFCNAYDGDVEQYITDHTMPFWKFYMKEPLIKYEVAMDKLRMEAMPFILEASESCTTKEDKALMKSYVKERFGIAL